MTTQPNLEQAARRRMKLKVYGVTHMIGYKLPKEFHARNSNTQKRVVMATTSWNKFAAALGVPVGTLRNYGSITGNKAEIEWCEAHPEQPFYLPVDYKTTGFLPLP